VRVYNLAGAETTAEDVFYVKKDNVFPTISDNQAGDFNWRNSSGTIYDVDFQDDASLLNSAQYRVFTGPGQTGAERVPLTPIFDSAALAAYADDWPLSSAAFDALLEGATNYVSLRVEDNAGNVSSLTDAFLVFKDTTAPTITDNQMGDDTTYYANPGAVFDVDFNDAGGSLLKNLQFRVFSEAGQSGTLIKDWTEIALTVNATYYDQEWGIGFGALQLGKNYVSVRAFDHAGGSVTQSDVFYVFKGTGPPNIIDNQAGDFVWRRQDGTLYNVAFSSNSDAYALDYFQTRAARAPIQQSLIQDWTTAVFGISAAEYTDPWALPGGTWDLLEEGTNYISVRVVDVSGSSGSASDVFFVLKDTTPPSITDNQPGDAVWRRAEGTLYDVDFHDLASGLTTVQYTVSSAAGLSGGVGDVLPWTTIASGLDGAPDYDTDWPAAFSSLTEGTNYVSVRAHDRVEFVKVSTDVFTILKDTTPPTISNAQGGDDFWRIANTGLYDVNFLDSGGSQLARFEIRVSTMSGDVGPFLVDFTTIVASINAATYTADWSLPNAVFDALPNGPTNYVTVRVFDVAGSSDLVVDAFYVLKDTVPPVVADNQPGETLWRDTDAGPVYDVDFSDLQSQLTTVQYTVSSSAGLSGGEGDIVPWTDIAAPPVSATSFSSDWAVAFASLPEGRHFVSARAYDVAGNSATAVDVFEILKDTSPPVVTDLQTGDTVWRRSPDTTYDVDFSDLYSSLATAQYTVSATPGLSGGEGEIVPWSDIAVGIDSTSYTTDWSVNFSAFTEGATNYVSVRAFDALNHVTTGQDVFFVLKDMSKPTIQNLVVGDDTWRKDPGTLYDVNFYDSGGSHLDTVKYTVHAVPGLAAGEGNLVPWTTIATGIGTDAYTDDWPIAFSALPEGQSYLSVRAWDVTGDTETLTDAFYVRKDTSAPTVTDNQSGDTAFRSSNNGSYDVDFADAGGSQLALFEIKVSTLPGGAGPYLVDFTTVVANINAASYTAAWSLPNAVFEALFGGGTTNYITVRVWDAAGSSTAASDVFYVKKDTEPPMTVDNQEGDDTWQRTGGTLYNVDFQDAGGARLDRVQYTASSGPGLPGGVGDLVPWTDIASSLNALTYTTNWGVAFSSLTSGSNWISARSIDNAGNVSSVATDVFYIKKDTQPPSGTAMAPAAAKTVNLEVPYAVSDTGPAGVQHVKLYYTTQQQTPYAWTPWGTTFTASPISFTAAGEGTYGFRIVAYDNANNTDESVPPASTTAPESSTVVDMTLPEIDDLQTGDDVWRGAAGTVYNVDFRDPGGSRLTGAHTPWTPHRASPRAKAAWCRGRAFSARPARRPTPPTGRSTSPLSNPATTTSPSGPTTSPAIPAR